LSVPLLASSIVFVGLWVVGTRVVFSLPLDLPASWIFRVAPFGAGQRCLRARRRTLLVVSIAPPLAASAALLFCLWPWRPAAAHMAALAFAAIILAEFSFDGVQRIPFTCSYLPGRSKFHLTFWLWLFLLGGLVLATADNERKALETFSGTVAVLTALGAGAIACVLRNNWLARRNTIELRFDEVPSDQLLSLDLGS
jgi:hypothetical protein